MALYGPGIGGVSVLLGNGDGTFRGPAYGRGWYGVYVTVGDFNKDGKPDLVVASEAGGVSVRLGNGDGSFQTAIPVRTAAAHVVAVGDFNGDGKADLAVGSGPVVQVALGIGDGTFQDPVRYSGVGLMPVLWRWATSTATEDQTSSSPAFCRISSPSC